VRQTFETFIQLSTVSLIKQLLMLHYFYPIYYYVSLFHTFYLEFKPEIQAVAKSQLLQIPIQITPSIKKKKTIFDLLLCSTCCF